MFSSFFFSPTVEAARVGRVVYMVLYINPAYMCMLGVERELCPLEKGGPFS